MKQLNSRIMLAVVFAFLLAGALQGANTMSGTIYSTTLIYGTTRLTGNVTCDLGSLLASAPCIQFGGPNAELDLNGFTIMGDIFVSGSGCPESGAVLTAIDTNGQNYAKVRGPGLITGFTGDGIDVTGSNSDVDHVAITFVGGNGILLNGAGVRNTVLLNSVSAFSICATGAGGTAGIAVQGTGKNQIQQNAITGALFSFLLGSGGLAPAIGASSNNNTILENNVSGNLRGIVVSGVSNVIQANQAIGNPAGDIVDTSTSPGNTYLGNLCQFSSLNGSQSSLCPKLPFGLMGNPIVLQNQNSQN
jgi:parallel beta-helix repeat protein